MRLRRWLVHGVAVVCAMAVATTACGDDAARARPEVDGATRLPAASPQDPSEGDPELSGTLVIFAATSLADVFTDLGQAFEAAHPQLDVTFNFAASSELATQLEEGAPADVFAAADEATMGRVVDAGVVEGEPLVFARNRLEIVVGAGNPEGITGLADLTAGRLTVALCAPEVPCGAYATRAFERAGLEPPRASQEQNVRAVVEKVALGEADAGIAYVTDVVARADDVDGIDLPEHHDVDVRYPLATLDLGGNRAAAAAWMDQVRSPQALEVLTAAGFLAP